MTTLQILLVAVAVVCIAPPVGAFAIAARRGSKDAQQVAAHREPGDGRRRSRRSPAGPGDRAGAPVEVAEAEEAAPAEPEPAVPQPVEAGPLRVVEEERLEEVSPEEMGSHDGSSSTGDDRHLRSVLGDPRRLDAGDGVAQVGRFRQRRGGGLRRGPDRPTGPTRRVDHSGLHPVGAQLRHADHRRGVGKSQFADTGTSAEGLIALYQRCVHLGCRAPGASRRRASSAPATVEVHRRV